MDNKMKQTVANLSTISKQNGALGNGEGAKYATVYTVADTVSL